MFNKQGQDFPLENYRPPFRSCWSGRDASANAGDQYWHQTIKLLDLNTQPLQLFDSAESEGSESDIARPDIALLGYACNEGVRRNLGRTGAADGPTAIRERLAKLSYHHDSKSIVDLGDVICADQNLEATQASLATQVQYLIRKSIFPILIGGGHDIAYGHFQGIWNAVKDTSKPKIGILNFDAHFDLRPVDSAPNSGTPFNQILKEHGDKVEYFALGIQKEANPKELFDIAEKEKVSYLLNYECDNASLEMVKQKLLPFIQRNDWIYVTIDMDGFSSAYAPGVSAPSPLGFTPYFVINTLKFLFASSKVISCDIAELNPKYDRDNATANLAARIVDFVAGECCRH